MVCYLYIISLFIPLEVFVNLGPVRMEPYRFILIISFIQFIKQNKHRVEKSSRILFLYIFFSFIALAVSHGFTVATQSSGILFLEICGSYWLGMMYVTDKQKHKKYLLLIASLYFWISIPSWYEFVTGSKPIHAFFEKITGHVQLATDLYTESYIRLGFTRVTSVFAHPILYSISAVALLPIVIAILRNTKTKRMAFLRTLFGLFTAIITSITSAGIGAVLLQTICRLWFDYKDKIGIYKNVIITGIVIMFAVIQFGSNRGLIKFLAASATLNPQTGYYRILQWEFASDDIAENFWFGIGNNAWTHPEWFADSVDSYWLLNMITYGFFSTAMLVWFFLYSAKRTFIKSVDGEIQRLLLGYRIMFISIIYAGLTVDFFDRLQPLLYFLIGTSLWLYKPENITKEPLIKPPKKMN